jgi:hypothetical protein
MYKHQGWADGYKPRCIALCLTMQHLYTCLLAWWCAGRGGAPRAGPQQVLKLQHSADEMPLEVVVQVSLHQHQHLPGWL